MAAALNKISPNGKQYIPFLIEIRSYRSPIKIGSLFIRKISQEERERYLNVKSVEKRENGFGITLVKSGVTPLYMLVLGHMKGTKLQSSEFIIATDGNDSSAHKDIPRLLLALRLYKNGKVEAPIMLYENGVCAPLAPMFMREVKDYVIDAQEFIEVKKIYQRIVANFSEFEPAFDRFNNALSFDTNKKNAFIDFVTILESRLLKNNSSEVSFRFSLYAGYLLNDILKIKTSYKEICDIYTARSELVHGGKSSKFNDGVLDKVRDMARAILDWELRNPKINIKDLIFQKLKIPQV